MAFNCNLNNNNNIIGIFSLLSFLLVLIAYKRANRHNTRGAVTLYVLAHLGQIEVSFISALACAARLQIVYVK